MGKYVCRECGEQGRSYAQLRFHFRRKHPARWDAIQSWANPSRLHDPAEEFTFQREQTQPERFDPDTTSHEVTTYAGR